MTETFRTDGYTEEPANDNGHTDGTNSACRNITWTASNASGSGAGN